MVEFSRTGDLGEKGATGEKGEKGATGEKGAAGSPGAVSWEWSEGGEPSGSKARVSGEFLEIGKNTFNLSAIASSYIKAWKKAAVGSLFVIFQSETKWQVYRVLEHGEIAEEGTSKERLKVKVESVGGPGLSLGVETLIRLEEIVPTNWGLVTALPTSPVAGDKCQYIADKTNGVIWDLVYDGEGEFPWKKIGGPPLFAEVTTSQSTESKAYAALATAGPSVTVPLKGDYDVQVGAGIGNTGASASRMSYDIGGTGAVDADSFFGESGAGVTACLTRVRRKAGLAATTALVAKYKVSANAGFFSNRWMRVDPIRVG
jgi:hypothetical protein